MILVSFFTSRKQTLNNSASCRNARHEQVFLCHCGNEKTGQLQNFCADSPFSCFKVAAVLWLLNWSGRDETCISSGGSPRSGEARGLHDRKLGSSFRTSPGRRVSLACMDDSFWMFPGSMSHDFNCFRVYQLSSGTTASERGPVVNHPEAETSAGT